MNDETRICKCCGKEKFIKDFENSIFTYICSKCYYYRRYRKLKKEDVYQDDA